MNPLDEIEMEMKGAESMKYVCAYTGNGCYRRRAYMSDCIDCPFYAPIPVEPERVKGRCQMDDDYFYAKCASRRGSEFCTHCNHWITKGPLTPFGEAVAVLDRLSLITYPELFICSKAGECSAPCSHGSRHKRTGLCDAISWCPVGRASHTCIPYVPEDEAREWFVVAKDTGAWVDGSGLLDTKERALELIRARQRHNLRAFKWSDGLKGGE